jgi:hypothetical protein
VDARDQGIECRLGVGREAVVFRLAGIVAEQVAGADRHVAVGPHLDAGQAEPRRIDGGG